MEPAEPVPPDRRPTGHVVAGGIVDTWPVCFCWLPYRLLPTHMGGFIQQIFPQHLRHCLAASSNPIGTFQRRVPRNPDDGARLVRVCCMGELLLCLHLPSLNLCPVINTKKKNLPRCVLHPLLDPLAQSAYSLPSILVRLIPLPFVEFLPVDR